MSPEEALRLSRKVAGSVGRGRGEDVIDDLASAALNRWCTETFDPDRGGDEHGYVLQRMRWAALRELQRIDGRRRRRHVRIVSLDDAPASAVAEITDELLNVTCDELAADLLDRLTDRPAVVAAALVADPERPHHEIAAELGVSRSRVSQLLRPVKAALGQILEEAGRG